MTFKRIFAECCYQPWCSHYPRETGGDPLQAAAKRTHSPSERHVTEAHVQARLVQALKDAGAVVYRVGQRNARGTMDPGVPDLLCFLPNGRFIFVEVKRPIGGRVSPAQIEFQEHSERCGVAHVIATRIEDITPWLALEPVTRSTNAMRGARWGEPQQFP